MDWIRIKTIDGKTVYLNTNEILCLSYDEDAELTEIVVTRSGYSPLFVSGDITKDFHRMLAANLKGATTLG